MIVYIDRLNIVNVLALAFKCACVDVSIESDANGTDVDDITVSLCAVLDSCVAFGFATIVAVSNDGDNGTFDVWSGNGASGTYGANGGTFSVPAPKRGWVSVDGCWTFEYPPEDGGTATVVVVTVSPDAAILGENTMKISNGIVSFINGCENDDVMDSWHRPNQFIYLEVVVVVLMMLLVDCYSHEL